MNFIFDIDGTICFDGCSINPSIKQRLFKLRQANHNVMFASARPIRDLLPVIPEFADDTLIGGNGSIISKNGQIEIVSVINEHDISLIKKLIKKYQLSYISLMINLIMLQIWILIMNCINVLILMVKHNL